MAGYSYIPILRIIYRCSCYSADGREIVKFTRQHHDMNCSKYSDISRSFSKKKLYRASTLTRIQEIEHGVSSSVFLVPKTQLVYPIKLIEKRHNVHQIPVYPQSQVVIRLWGKQVFNKNEN